MARIPTYQKDTYISDLDRLIGTDGDTNELVTKNFFLGNIAEYVIDKFIDPDAVSFTIPVLRDTQDTLGSNATRITGSIMSQDINPDGTKITITGDLTLERDQSDTTLTLISDGSNVDPGGEQHNPSIKFIQDGGAQNAAVGFNIIDDTSGGTIPGSGNRFWIVNAMDDNVGVGGITFGTAQVDGWENAIGRFMIRGDGKGLFGHPDSLYSKTLGSQFEIYDNRDENTTTDSSFSVYSVVDYAAPSGNEGAGGIKQILDVYNNGVFEQQQALMLIPGTNSSDFAASTPIAFYTNSDMDTVGPSGFAGMIFDSGNWLLDGSGTFTTTDPGYQLKVAGTGFFTDQVTIPETPVAGTDAASKAYVDAQNTGQVSGTGTTNTLPIWTDGPNSELGDSIVSELANRVYVAGSLLVGTNNVIPGTNALTAGENNNVLGNSSVAFGSNNEVSGNRCGGLGSNNLVAGGQVWATGDGNNVGIDKLNVGGNIVTAGFNNTVKSGSSCVVGTSNTLTNTTESSGINTNFAMGSQNTLNDAADGIVLGFNNTVNDNNSCVLGKSNITSAEDTYAIGKSNTLSSADDYVFGLNNTISSGADVAMALGHNNILSGGQSYAFGRNLEDGGEDNTVIIGRYNETPTATGRIVFGTGFSPTGRKNAIEIQNGTSDQSGLLFPALRLSRVYANDADAAAAGVEKGELYRSSNQVRINIDQTVQDARNNEGVAYLTPLLKTAVAGGSSGLAAGNYNLVLMSWTGGNGTYTLRLPQASQETNRFIRIATDGTLGTGAGDKINITANGSDTIDGAAFYQISKSYEGVAIYSTGTEWIVIQAKAH